MTTYNANAILQTGLLLLGLPVITLWLAWPRVKYNRMLRMA